MAIFNMDVEQLAARFVIKSYVQKWNISTAHVICIISDNAMSFVSNELQ